MGGSCGSWCIVGAMKLREFPHFETNVPCFKHGELLLLCKSMPRSIVLIGFHVQYPVMYPAVAVMKSVELRETPRELYTAFLGQFSVGFTALHKKRLVNTLLIL